VWDSVIFSPASNLSSGLDPAGMNKLQADLGEAGDGERRSLDPPLAPVRPQGPHSVGTLALGNIFSLPANRA
jgi:hypothetical protein